VRALTASCRCLVGTVRRGVVHQPQVLTGSEHAEGSTGPLRAHRLQLERCERDGVKEVSEQCMEGRPPVALAQLRGDLHEAPRLGHGKVDQCGPSLWAPPVVCGQCYADEGAECSEALPQCFSTADNRADHRKRDRPNFPLQWLYIV
jgi:hypothetical protein